MTRAKAYLMLLPACGLLLLSCGKEESGTPPKAAAVPEPDQTRDRKEPAAPATMPAPPLPPPPRAVDLSLRAHSTLQRQVRWRCTWTVGLNTDGEPRPRQVREEAAVLMGLELGRGKSSDQVILRLTYVRPPTAPAGGGPPRRVLDAIGGKSFEACLGADGRVVSIKDVGALTEAVKRAVSERAIVTGLETSFGAPSFQEMIEQLIPPRPTAPVSAGREWTQTSRMTGAIAASVRTTWRLEHCGSGIARITGESKVRPGKTPTPLRIGPAKITCRMSGSGKAQLSLDENNGLPLRYELNQHLDGEMSIESPGVSATWPVTVTSDELITVTAPQPQDGSR